MINDTVIKVGAKTMRFKGSGGPAKSKAQTDSLESIAKVVASDRQKAPRKTTGVRRKGV